MGFYQSFRPGAVDKVEWVQGVAILVAIVVITIVQALNDYQKESKFSKLNEIVCGQCRITSLIDAERKS